MKKLKIGKNNIIKALIILLIGLVVTILSTRFYVNDIESNKRNQYLDTCNKIKNKIFEKLGDHSQLLLSGTSFFAASNEVTRKEWKKYNEIHLKNNLMNGVQGLGYSLIIKPSELKSHLNKIKAEGFPEYKIKPNGLRETYTSIIFLEPFSGRNIRAFGYDMFTEPIRRKAMEIARDSNMTLISGKVTLVQETNNDIQSGILMFAPVYQNGQPTNNIDERRKAIIGWVYSPFRMNDLMNGILSNLDVFKDNQIHLEIYDNENISKESLLYDSKPKDSIKQKDIQNRMFKTSLNFNNNKWTLVFSKSSEESVFLNREVILIFISGLTISFLFFGLFISSIITQSKAEQIAEKLTINLKEASQYARNLIEVSIDSLVTISPEGKITDVNKATEVITGYNRNELIGSDFADYFLQPNLARIGYQKVFLDGQVIDYPLEIKNKNGNVFDVLYNASLYRNDNGEILGIFAAARDISERKKIEALVKEKYDLLLKHSQNVPGVIYQFQSYPDGSSRFPFSSKGIWEVYEVKPEDVIDDASIVFTRLHKDDYNGVVESITYSRESLNIWKYDYRVVLPTRGIRWLRGIASPERIHDGSTLWHGYIQDITESKLLEEILKESESRFRNMADTAPVLMWISGIDKLCYYFNKVWLEFTGRTIEQEYGNGWAEGVHPDDLDRCIDIYVNSFDKRESFSMEYRLKHNSGEYRWILDNGKPRFLDNGEFIGFIGSCTDISELKEIQEELKFNKERWEFAIEGSNDGLWDWYVSSNSVFFSPRWKSMLGFAENELENTLEDWSKRVHPEDLDFVNKEINNHLEGLTPLYITEHRELCKDGTYIWILDRGKVIQKDTNGKPIRMIGTHADITERKLIEKEILHKNKELAEMNASKDKFFSIIAHDLKSPFNGFLGLTKLMAESPETLTLNEITEISVALQNSAKNLYSLLENLLEWSRMQRGMISYTPEKVMLKYLVDQNFGILKNSANQKNIKLIEHLPYNYEVTADIPMLNTVLRNLISNSIKFTEKGGTIEVGLKDEAQTKAIYIKDNGIGMDDDIKNKLFKLEEKVSRPGTEGESSTGLGLLLCKDFIEKHSGKIWVESQVDKGSTFYFTINKTI